MRHTRLLLTQGHCLTDIIFYSCCAINRSFFVVFILLIFYFLLIKPQQKKEKNRLSMLKAVKKNDEIVTSGGIHATVLNVKEKTITVRIDDNVKIEIEKDFILRIEKVAG